jgi:hypothetical protein
MLKLTLYPYTPYVVIRVEGDFIQENSCMRPTNILSYPYTRICGVKVTFKPTTSGVRMGAIYAGTQRIAVLSGTGADLVEAAKTVQENSTLAQKMNQTSPATAAAWANYTSVVNSGVGSAIAAALQYDQALLDAEKAELEAQAKQFEYAVQNMQDMVNTFGDHMTDVKQKLQEMMEVTWQINSKIGANV